MNLTIRDDYPVSQLRGASTLLAENVYPELAEALRVAAEAIEPSIIAEPDAPGARVEVFDSQGSAVYLRLRDPDREGDYWVRISGAIGGTTGSLSGLAIPWSYVIEDATSAKVLS